MHICVSSEENEPSNPLIFSSFSIMFILDITSSGGGQRCSQWWTCQTSVESTDLGWVKVSSGQRECVTHAHAHEQTHRRTHNTCPTRVQRWRCRNRCNSKMSAAFVVKNVSCRFQRILCDNVPEEQDEDAHWSHVTPGSSCRGRGRLL